MKRNQNLFAAALFVLVAAFPFSLFSQQWGWVTLIARQGQTTASLIDTNSQVAKQWTGLSGNTGYSSHLMPGGVLWRSCTVTGASFSGGGICGRIQKVSYTGAILWDYTFSSTSQITHHDFCPLPNGNVLVIVYEKKTAAEVQAVGGPNAARWTEKVVEIQPSGTSGGNIVWEWKLWDHLMTTTSGFPNYYPSALNNRHRLNINYNNTRTDWVHMNGIDYNSSLNQIVVSSHWLNEFWVIDHSTTTSQAATSSGGQAGKGGDFLYRWGNPAAYGATGTTQFNVLHDSHWIPSDCPDAGMIGAYNNGGGTGGNSALTYCSPPLSGYNYPYTAGQEWAPTAPDIDISGPAYSSNMGSTNQLPNGNHLFCAATNQTVYELTAAGSVLWSYSAGGNLPQAHRYDRCYIEQPSTSATASNSTICSGASVQLFGSGSAVGGPTFSYSWSPTTGLSNPNNANPIVSGISVPMTYTLTATTAGGCSAEATVSIGIATAPAANAGPDVSIPSGGSTILMASGGGTYAWSNGAMTQSTAVSPAMTTTYTVTVTAANGCTATDQVVVTVTGAALSATATASPATVCAGQGSTLSVSYSGGAGSPSYLWSNGATTATANVSPGATTNYQVTVTVGAQSTTTQTTVTVNPAPAANAGPDVTIVAGQSTLLTASGGTSFLWSNGATTASTSVSPAATTTFSVTVSSGAGCTAIDDVTVTVVPLLYVNVSASPTSFCSDGSSQLFASAGGGTGSYSFSWASSPVGFSSSLASPTVAPTVSTTYFVTVTSGTQTATGSVAITVFPNPTANAGPDVTILQGQSTTLTASGGSGFLWSNGATTAATTVSPAATTTFSVTVSNANGCKAVDEVVVTVNPAMSVDVSASPAAFCAGGSTQLFATATGGNGSFSYQWASSPVGFSSSLASPFAALMVSTTYFVTVTSGAATATGSVLVTVFPLPTANAGPDVSIAQGSSTMLTASGGGSFLWSNGAATAATTVSPLATTTFSVTATNASGCTDDDQVTVTVTSSLGAAASSSPAEICVGSSSQLFATATGGTGSYGFSWTSIPAGFVSNLQNPAVAPTVSTTYFLTVSSGAATATATTAVTVDPLPTANAGPDQTIVAGQSATLTASGGSDYQWSNGETTASTTVAPGATTAFSVTVSGANGCSAVDQVLVTVVPPLAVSTSAQPGAICSGSSAQLFATATGGTGGYGFSWASTSGGFSSNLASPTVVPTVSTTYFLTVTSGSQTATASVSVVVNALPAASAGPDQTIIAGQSATLTASGGTAFLWSNGATTAATTVSPGATSAFSVTVFDQNGCSATDAATVFVNQPIAAAASASPAAFCAGGSSQLFATATGGNGNFSFSWSANGGAPFSNLQNPTVSPAATTVYSVTVSDANGSSVASATVTVNALPTANAGADQTILAGNSATLTASGGTAFLWSNGATTAATTVSPTSSATFSVTVSTAGGCSAVDQVSVAVVQPISATAEASNAAFCAGGSTTLSVATTGGTSNLSFSWSSSPGVFLSNSASPVVSPTVSTTYTVTVSDGFSTATATVGVTVFGLPTADAGADQTINLGGSATLTAGGGSGFLWSNGATTASTTVSPAATTAFSVTVSNQNGCTATDQMTVVVITNQPVGALASASKAAICTGETVGLSAGATGGNGSYGFSWASIPSGFSSNLASPVFSPTVSTTFLVTVTDGLGASATSAVSVAVNGLPTANAGADQTIIAGQTATLTATGGSGFLWSNGATAAQTTVSPTAATTFSVTVSNAAGCSATDQVLIHVLPAVSVAATGSAGAICAGKGVILTASAANGTGNFSYGWSSDPAGIVSNQAVFTAFPTQNSTFTVTVSDGVGAATASFSVVVNAAPTVDAGADQTILIGSAAILTASGGGDYLWTTGETTASISVSPTVSTIFSVTVSNAAGCTAVDAATVTVTGTPLSASVSATPTTVCIGQNAQLSALPSGGSGSYSFAWSSGGVVFSTAQNPTVSPAVTTIYSVEISDGAGTVTATVSVGVAQPPSASAGLDQVIFSGQSAVLTASGGQTFLWSNGSTAASITVSPTVSTPFSVTVTSAEGCTGAATVWVNVQNLPPLGASVSATDSVVCEGDIIQLFAAGTGGTGNFSYAWASDPAGFVSNLADPFVNPFSTTTYTVTVTDGQGTTATASLQILVNGLPPQPTVTVVGDSLVTTATGNLQWFFYGSPIQDATGQVYVPTLTGEFQVQSQDANGCFSPPSDPLEIIVSTRENMLPENAWSLAPNPTDATVFVRFDGVEKGFSIEISGADGRLVHRFWDEKKLDLGSLPAGFYLVRLATEKGVGLKKLVVAR